MCLNSCTVYTEKQSEVASQAVYATKDSIDLARFDLAEDYINQTTALIKPPKNRIRVDAIYQKPVSVNSVTGDTKQRVVLVPEKYKNDKVIIVNSTDYETLITDKEVVNTLKKNNDALIKAKANVEKEQIKQKEMGDKMVKDLNIMQKKLVEKDLAILWRNIVIVVLSLLIAGMLYLRFKGGGLF